MQTMRPIKLERSNKGLQPVQDGLFDQCRRFQESCDELAEEYEACRWSGAAQHLRAQLAAFMPPFPTYKKAGSHSLQGSTKVIT